MELPAFFDGTDNALTQSGGAQTNVGVAKLAVGGVTLAINLVLLLPRAMFVGTLTVEPEPQSEGWVWSKTFPVLGVQTDLIGTRDESLDLEMHVTGTHANTSRFQDFVWFDGAHRQTAGMWQFYDAEPDTLGEPLLRIDWERVSATDKQLVFTNVTSGREGSGDTITYRLDGTTASMSIHDARNQDGVEVDFAVQWSTEDGAGRMTANGEAFCWDSLGNGQVNVPCP
jgi:hypothetical protein